MRRRHPCEVDQIRANLFELYYMSCRIRKITSGIWPPIWAEVRLGTVLPNSDNVGPELGQIPLPVRAKHM